jgi:hypothetical protein
MSTNATQYFGQGSTVALTSTLFAKDVFAYTNVVNRYDNINWVKRMAVLDNIETGGKGQVYNYAERGFTRDVIIVGGNATAGATADAASFTVPTTASPYSIQGDINFVPNDIVRNQRTGVCFVIDTKTGVGTGNITLGVKAITTKTYNPSTDAYIGRQTNGLLGVDANAIAGLTGSYPSTLSGTTFSANILQGDILTRIGNVYPQGSNFVNIRGIMLPQIFSTYSQTFRSGIKATGTSMKIATTMDNVFYESMENEVFEQHLTDIAFQCTIGAVGQVTLTNGTTGGTANLATSQEAYIQLHGTKLEYDSAIRLSDIDTAVYVYNREMAAKDRMLKCGQAASLSLDNLMIELNKNGGVVYDQKMVDLEYKAFARGGYKFYYDTAQEFTHPKLGAAAGAASYNGKIFDTPYKTVVNPKDLSMGKAMKLVFTEGRQYIYADYGIMSKAKQTQFDGQEIDYTSEAAFLMIGGNQSIIWQN